MNLLKKRADEIIALKEIQITEKNSFINFDFENSTLFLYLDPLIWSALDEFLDSFWQFFNSDEIFLAASDNLSNS